MQVKLEKDTLIIRLPLKVPQPLRAGLPQVVPGNAKVQRTKIQIAGADLYVVANAFVYLQHDTTPRKRTVTPEVITPKMRDAEKALEERWAAKRRKWREKR